MMRLGRRVEFSAWILGIAALGLYAATRLSLEHARLTGLAALRDAPDSRPASQTDAPALNQIVPPAIHVDQSLWSSQRVSAFTDSVATPGAPEGALRIPALQIEVPIYLGATERNLNRGAAHIEGTAALSDAGNIGIAAHRDGFFRKLKDIAIDDEVHLYVDGRTRHYRVVDISVVSPSDVQVLAPTEVPSVTLVTCYPFYFLGSAPERYIVRAELAAAPTSATERS
jgi:sortase A